MSYTASEIDAQPVHWRRVLQLLETKADSLLAVLRPPVALVGAGSSYYMALAAASYLEGQAGVPARAVPASVYRSVGFETVIFISRSGTTTEVLEAADRARTMGLTSWAITCSREGPLAQRVAIVVALDFIHEQSVVQTGSATSAFLTLRALADRRAGRPFPSHLVTELEDALVSPVQANDPIEHLVMLGSDWRFGIACEAALKAQEMAALWTERYVPLEYRHGPISCAGERSLFVILDPPNERLQALARDIEATGATVIFAHYDPLVELVRLQKLALAISLRRGLNPDVPRHLTRSVVLDA